MAKTQTYEMHVGSDVAGTQQATTPNRALREFFGERLASSDGRYGRLTDGTTCTAYLVHGGRRYYGRT